MTDVACTSACFSFRLRPYWRSIKVTKRSLGCVGLVRNNSTDRHRSKSQGPVPCLRWKRLSGRRKEQHEQTQAKNAAAKLRHFQVIKELSTGAPPWQSRGLPLRLARSSKLEVDSRAREKAEEEERQGKRWPPSSSCSVHRHRRRCTRPQTHAAMQQSQGGNSAQLRPRTLSESGRTILQPQCCDQLGPRWPSRNQLRGPSCRDSASALG